MTTTIRSTDLDFDIVKNRLKEFFKQQSEFADYDFEASGLSNILDVIEINNIEIITLILAREKPNTVKEISSHFVIGTVSKKFLSSSILSNSLILEVQPPS